MHVSKYQIGPKIGRTNSITSIFFSSGTYNTLHECRKYVILNARLSAVVAVVAANSFKTAYRRPKPSYITCYILSTYCKKLISTNLQGFIMGLSHDNTYTICSEQDIDNPRVTSEWDYISTIAPRPYWGQSDSHVHEHIRTRASARESHLSFYAMVIGAFGASDIVLHDLYSHFETFNCHPDSILHGFVRSPVLWRLRLITVRRFDGTLAHLHNSHTFPHTRTRSGSCREKNKHIVEKTMKTMSNRTARENTVIQKNRRHYSHSMQDHRSAAMWLLTWGKWMRAQVCAQSPKLAQFEQDLFFLCVCWRCRSGSMCRAHKASVWCMYAVNVAVGRKAFTFKAHIHGSTLRHSHAMQRTCTSKRCVVLKTLFICVIL